MIKLENISKTYISKKGKDTKALVNINLELDDTGMTFILGKSGSGKSTLLNILGGLDKYDTGDMEILGKSSKDFTQADLDSYRNTYVGFVFQEFNILDDYDVYENIVLALQLQQKEQNEEEINNLLDKLGLTELKRRKVNELSGGEKQRVAIARALIKNPKIILADEPTGNLDSTTGKQVMDLLKEISKEKLVVVISHDKEAANLYADRIIEIKDGEILADKKIEEKAKGINSPYQIIKSKLPFKDSFKLGAGSLKHKKIKLFFTILLTIISLGFFSASDTLSNYDISKSHAELLLKNHEKFVQVEEYEVGDDDINYYNKTLIEMSKENKEKIKENVSKDTYSIYQFYNNQSLDALLQFANYNEDYYNMQSLYSNVELVVSNDIEELTGRKVLGKLPTNENEIVISNYLADLIIKIGVRVPEQIKKDEFVTTDIFEPKDYEEIINSPYTFYLGEDNKVKIVGIIDYDLEEYASIKNKKSNENLTKEEQKLVKKLSSEAVNIYNKIFVSKSLIDKLNQKEILTFDNFHLYEISSDEVEFLEYGNYYTPLRVLNNEYYNGSEWLSNPQLNDNEVILNAHQLKYFDNYMEQLNNYLNNQELNYGTEEDYNKSRLDAEKKFFANYVKNSEIIGKTINLLVYGKNASYGDTSKATIYENIKVVGIYGLFYEDPDAYNISSYFSSNISSNYKTNNLLETGILIPISSSEKEIIKLDKDYPFESNLSLKSTYSADIYEMLTFTKSLKKLFFYASLIFLIFAILLISNFIVNSIQYRKKEIGILRALGSRSFDIIKIFLWEGLTIALISGTIASILLVIVSNLCNNFLTSTMGLLFAPFQVGIRQFVVLYVFVLVVSIIASIIPIIRISKMKPIDAILNK